MTTESRNPWDHITHGGFPGQWQPRCETPFHYDYEWLRKELDEL